MKDEDWIIGRAVYDILQSGQKNHISRKMLVDYLTRKYVYIYEHSDSVEEVLLYESALNIIICSPE
ncbi:Uncharacterised protein [Metakosakonia massiliensis]|uniref:Uncharacterized protein n=1 Tax=Phytobacter massiliensis TaxID=1485952 RepID=A0A6N3FWQ0_9ENTR